MAWQEIARDRKIYTRRTGSDSVPHPLATPLDEAVPRKTRRRAVLVSGLGFFADAYDLFVIGIVSTLLKSEWHLHSGQLAAAEFVIEQAGEPDLGEPESERTAA